MSLNIKNISVCFFAILFCFTLLNELSAKKDTKKMLNEKTEPPVKEEGKKFFGALGIGYYIAMGDLGAAVKPGISIKGVFQYSRIKYDFLGAEIEAGYTDLKDKEFDGGMTFIYFIPSLMYLYSVKWCDFQFKAGAGVTSASSSLTVGGKSQSGSSLDLTAGIGASVLKTFNDRYVAGLDVKYYYIFETVKTGALAFNIIMGARF